MTQSPDTEFDLNKLLADAVQENPVRPPSVVSIKPKINYTHDALIDMIIAHPEMNQNQLAAYFGYTASWISTIMTSDAFQSKLADRRKAVIDPLLAATVEEQFKGLVYRSQQILMEKLSKPSDEVSDQLAVKALEIASRGAGYGKDQNPVTPPGQVHNHLHILGENLVQLLRRKKEDAINPVLEPAHEA